MEQKKSQNKNSTGNFSNSETYHSKSSKQQKRSSLVKRRNTAVTLSVISSVILAGIGYEIVASLNSETITTKVQEQPTVPLRILSEEDDYISMSTQPKKASDLDFDEEVNIIQQLTRHKNLQSKKIRELKEDLEEARARIVQLKTDILIKGGEKEQYYRDQIDEFNRQISNFEQENTNLNAEVAIRDKLIESKRLELEKLSKVFTDTHDQLQSELLNRESEIEQQISKTEKIFQELKDELALTDKEIQTPEDVRDAIKETNERIAQLEAIIANANAESLEANDQAEEIADRLMKSQQELVEARETVQNLVLKVESQNLQNELLNKDLEQLLTAKDDQTLSPEMNGIAQQKILQKQEQLENVERRLQEALVQYANEKSLTDELSNRIRDLEASKLNHAASSQVSMPSTQQHGVTSYSNVARQQERLIKDLQRNLKNVERRNTELEQLLAQNANNAQQNDNSEIVKELNRELFNSKQKVRELEQDLAQLQSQGRESNAQVINKELNSLLEERSTLLAQVYEYRSDIQRQQEKISQLQDELSTASSASGFERDDSEIDRLKNKISLLEMTLSDREHQLEVATAKFSEESNESTGLVEMEEFYETKLSQLAKTNQILEEQLEEAEEYIKLTQSQLTKDQEQISSLQNQVKNIGAHTSSQSDKAIAEVTQRLQVEKSQREAVERELATLRDRFQQMSTEQQSSTPSSKDEQLKEQIQELQFMYGEEKNRSNQLESQLETLSRLASNLQEEMSAHEAALTQGGATSTPSRLRAKIAYLTTRLAQEKSKLMNSEEKLQEMIHTIGEMKDRNRQLEQQLLYR